MLFTLPASHYVGGAIVASVYAIRKKIYAVYEKVVKFLHAHL